MQLIDKLIRYMNIYTSQFNQQFLPIYILPKQTIKIVKKDYNILNNFGSYKNEKPVIKGLEVEKDDIDLVNKSSNTENHVKDILSGYINHVKLFGIELLSSLRQVRFIDEDFIAGIFISNIIYNHPRL